MSRLKFTSILKVNSNIKRILRAVLFPLMLGKALVSFNNTHGKSDKESLRIL